METCRKLLKQYRTMILTTRGPLTLFPIRVAHIRFSHSPFHQGCTICWLTRTNLPSIENLNFVSYPDPFVFMGIRRLPNRRNGSALDPDILKGLPG